MNIYKLHGQATPGIWKVARRQVVVDVGDLYEDAVIADFSLQTKMVGLKSGEWRPQDDELSANARLTAHCRNHFMKALEALKLAANAEECGGRDCEYCDNGLRHPKTQLAEELTVLVAKLEEVET